MSGMTLPPQKFREIVFQLLYGADFGSEEEGIELVMSALAVSKKWVFTAAEVKEKIVAILPQIDASIIQYAHSYDFDRIPKVEKTILRLSVYELLEKQVPSKVVFAEAIRLARKFATKESGAFINAVLDSFYKDQIDAKALA